MARTCIFRGELLYAFIGRFCTFYYTTYISTTAAVSGAILGTGLYMLTLIETLISKELRLQDVAAIPAVVALALGINVLISIIAAIPAIKNLNKVESIAQAANG